MPEAIAAKPFFGLGNFAPVDREISTSTLVVDGRVPPELDGVYIRNGPNPLNHDDKHHWFGEDGMVHGVAFARGKLSWYRNRYVQTKDLARQRAGEASTPGDVPNKANTSIVAHAGRIFALLESSLPTELSGQLETIGEYDFDGRLKTAFGPHPVVCPTSGEMHFLGYAVKPPFVTYHQVDAAGTLRHSSTVDVRGPTMMHGFALSGANAVFMDLPVVFDPAMLATPETTPFRWSDDYGARIGLVRRDRPDLPARWFDVEPCYAFHALNAYEEGDETVVEVVRYDEFWRGGPTSDSFNSERARLHRWRLGANGRVDEQPLDDRSIEYPRIDPRLAGRKHRYCYAIRTDDEGSGIGSNVLIKYDLLTGQGVEFYFPRARC